MKTITCTLEHYVEIVLHGRPYGFISKDSSIWQHIMMVDEEIRNNLVVIENEQWPIGYDTQLLPALDNGIYRLWNKKDWEICDNRRKQVVVTIEEKQKAYRQRLSDMKQAVKDDMIAKGVTEVVWQMISANMSDSQVEMMFNNIKKV